MNINESIWGTYAANGTELGTNRNIYYSNKAGASSLGEYRTTHGMTEPIDNSIAYWQLWDNSMFNSVAYCRRDGNNNSVLTVCRSITPKSIFLAVAPAASNMTFNPAQSSNLMWSSDVTSSIYTGTNYKILPWFNYNEIMVIFQLVTRKFDSDGKPTGSNVSRSIYSYYHDTDSDDLPLTTNWKIIAINVRFAHLSSSADTFAPFGEDVSVVSGTEIPFPQPNYYYTGGNYISYNGLRYANGVNSIGNQSVSSAGGYGSQQGAFGQSNNAYIYGYSPNGWVKNSYLNSSNQLIEYFECTLSYEEMLKQCASLGFWFNETIVTTSSATSWYNVLGENCTDDNVILPEIVGGQTTGNYKRGRQAGADPQAQWGADWRDNAGYNGDKPYKAEQNDGGDLSSRFNRPSISGTCNYYNFYSTNLRDLADFINSGYQPTDAEFITDFKGVNPADYIATCIYYPDGFTCPNKNGVTTSPVSIGALSGTDTGISAHVADTDINYISYAPYTIIPQYNDFRDYAPYTTLDLYVPFCGNIELDTAEFIGHTVQVYLLIDYPTGNCTAVVMRDSMIYDTINGTIGVTVPLTAQNMGSWQNSIKSAEIALKQAELQRKTAWLAAAGSGISLVAGVATMNPLAIAGGVGGLIGTGIGIEKANLTVENAQYQLTHTAASTRSISAASPANGLCLDYDCHLLIKRPIMANGFDDEIYSHTVGNACAITDYLSSFSGLTVVAEADLSGISAPAEIKTAILNALKSGVYV